MIILVNRAKLFLAFLAAVIVIIAACLFPSSAFAYTQKQLNEDVTINVFDYWVSERDEVYTNDNTIGINAGKSFNFTRLLSQNPYDGFYQGLVKPYLVDGYPMIDATGESLDYLFSPDVVNPYKATYTNVVPSSMFTLTGSDGTAHYSSGETFLELDSRPFSNGGNGMSFKRTNNSDLGFFPFNTYEQIRDTNQNESPRIYYFGMTVEIGFVQAKGGVLPNGGGTKFYFSGDDDVWVFIDGVLCLDLGGSHGARGGSIDFKTGDITYTHTDVVGPVDRTGGDTIKDCFERAGANSVWNGNTFADYTPHTIKIFYLERAAGASNCVMNFNTLNEYDIVPSHGPGGTVSPYSTISYYDGQTSVPYIITPQKYYSIKDVLVDGVSVGPVTSYNFGDVDSDHTIHATFEAAHGTLKVQKRDADTHAKYGQGSANLAGTKFEVMCLSSPEYQPNEIVATLIADANGYAEVELPAGKYEVYEVSASDSYNLTDTDNYQMFEIIRAGQVIDLTSEGNSFYNSVAKGGVQIKKLDADSYNRAVQGDGDMENAVFSVYNVSESSVMIDGTIYPTYKNYRQNTIGQLGGYNIGEYNIAADFTPCYTLHLDHDGAATTGMKLPIGKYVICETTAPTGYLMNDRLSAGITFEITNDNQMVAFMP